MFLLRRSRITMIAIFTFAAIHYVLFLHYSNLMQDNDLPIKDNFKQSMKPSGNGSDDVLLFASWLDHLCPKYHLRQKPNFKLKKEVPVDGSIFFTQTSCHTYFTAREACAIESANRHQPHRNIHVFMTAPFVNDSHPLMKVLMDIKKIKFSWMDLDEVFEDPLLNSWHRDRLWLYNTFQAPRFVSDAARVVLLWRYGGTYIDLDVITLKPLPEVPNFIGRMDEEQINLAISNFTKGHTFIDMLRKDLTAKFDLFKITSIGPALVTETLQQYCPGSLVNKEISRKIALCQDIAIFPPKYFYPVAFQRQPAVGIFVTGKGLGPQFFESTEAYTLHVYDSLTFLLKTRTDGDSILSEAARRHCPKVYNTILRHNIEI